MDSIKNPLTFTDEQKRAAAYALNMCTVSVSQIIDYDDLYVLEQEYDGILNNLNLEKMPKDEALLNILKQLLDTISYFRITEKERNIFEQEYQQKVKNAIWAAVPTVGLISTGGTLLSTAVSLASQVGIGYMNYRRAKANILLEKEKNEWAMQRTAMEQFHGLRRELFDAAWRLADRYNFPDEYRLTERQITEYNETLLDGDALRRYERLDYMRDKFEAYPPFWYQLGSSANEIARTSLYDAETRALYLGYAAENFRRYWAEAEHGLLREDQLLASCALEYFNIKLQESKKTKAGKIAKESRLELEALLDRAQKAAGNKYDVLQLCAISYLQLGEREKGAKILRMLVNQSYNKIVNAQLLSSLYIFDYIKTKDTDILIDYGTLAARVDRKYLFPLPRDGEDPELLEEAFIQAQKNLLSRKAANALKALAEKYTILYNRVIPAADLEDDHPDEYYSDGLCGVRKDNILKLLQWGNNQWAEFQERMTSYVSSILDALNQLYTALIKIHSVDEEIVHKRLVDQIQQHREDLSDLLIATGGRALTKENIDVLFSLDFRTMAASAFAYTLTEMWEYISTLNSMEEIVSTDAEIQDLCIQENLPLPDAAQLTHEQDTRDTAITAELRKIDLSLLGRVGAKENRKAEIRNELLECLKKYGNKLLIDGDKKLKIEFLLNDPNDSQFESYRQKNIKVLRKYKSELLAVIDDTTFGSGAGDLLFTTAGVIHYKEDSIGASASNTVPYKKVQQGKKSAILLNKITYNNSHINMRELYSLIRELAEIKQRHSGQENNSYSGIMSELSCNMPDDLLQLPIPQASSLPAGTNIGDFALRIDTVNFKTPGQCGVSAEVLGSPVHVGDHFIAVKSKSELGDNKVTVKTLRVDGYDLSMAQPGEHITLFLSVEGIEYSDLEGAFLKQEEELKATDDLKKTGKNQEEPVLVFPDERTVLASLLKGGSHKSISKSNDLAEEIETEELDELEYETASKMIEKANNVVRAVVATATATGAIPLPFADAPLLIAQQTAMMLQISKAFDIDIKEDGLKTLPTAVLGVSGATITGKTIATGLLKLVPVAGSFIGGAISASTAGAITLALGNAFIEVCKNIMKGKLDVEELTSAKGIDMLKSALKKQL